MHIHILGICGTFMGGVAALAREAGHKVTGCDAGVYPPMSEQLRALGIELIEGFGADQLALAPDMFVVGNVVSRARLTDGAPKFPLMEAILDAGLPYTSGPQWLAEHVLQGRHVLAVAGTHGKTTTTSMLAWILESAGITPGFLVGGVPLNFGISARLGAQAPGQPRPLFVIEADEYDTAFFDKRSKFVHYRPRTAVLNNLEFDHADIFDDLAAIERQFHHLLRTVPAAGRVVVNGLEESLARVLHQGCWSEVRSFGAAVSDFCAAGEPQAFDVLVQGQPQGRVVWSLTGVHNQLNALAAIAAAQHVGVPVAQAAQALAGFQNVRRRMELRGRVALPGGEVTVYDDFAHHPTAIRTTLDGLRRQLAAGQPTRILAVFEPRSNTMKLGTMKAQLPWALEPADLAFCHTGGLDWDAREALAPLGARAQTAPDIATLVRQVVQAAQPGDHIVCMSNGGFGGVHAKLLEELSKR
ncbi:UDP-N-acetylmuramate:L-alanyl-gamma-D-glutamyl-meso-diaminopimelate ligase [Extensimonas vulgaris]|uniref:UDP-N-acetylmuramate--L-alanyl-gamma-D-glutamyl-meso-2,6-diaminoheptandioate ligase n=1 Tax=Extensimonas vulgaris TaxID=1031594 RepID=A0A369ANK7_9BURK|nr:UDP-N-acetylmuramate:L-alanyl-gamma-D-glutamyl-meso-diaminopimelate ligase [Extensimonas vulgaris]RCX10972.1 UDP-N-acetylmuramate: L-alanyl-gamma-D-glutamyl-meso-diaminopimelate ligase [Extensimonas vulgaris]TWI41646.1 UDP-N-acetylmuramate: L-alanyl-gamma-D-glutamyl-meso-diaminopimelate ligase [Extensimonas vulgaris]TXD16118.1 UDP-N-acetylmuramate:L-alanyl-gamma-D-glutamyl-meso-diaminopimelate ligase [Extensimonas vulgaris]